ncbi:hypothetical protein IE53DRAFT_252417 [Violaceomyces palustris]|uniref:Uncharacterized protein n=1 Tax=Violaceomyces palustris TaxID=1673888 RepID=A0ACD0NNK4_9BASI|nr:hypothetical protein IE53DRAFT_252417 [Violaceomyces palustris]
MMGEGLFKRSFFIVILAEPSLPSAPFPFFAAASSRLLRKAKHMSERREEGSDRETENWEALITLPSSTCIQGVVGTRLRLPRMDHPLTLVHPFAPSTLDFEVPGWGGPSPTRRRRGRSEGVPAQPGPGSPLSRFERRSPSPSLTRLLSLPHLGWPPETGESSTERGRIAIASRSDPTTPSPFQVFVGIQSDPPTPLHPEGCKMCIVENVTSQRWSGCRTRGTTLGDHDDLVNHHDGWREDDPPAHSTPPSNNIPNQDGGQRARGGRRDIRMRK